MKKLYFTYELPAPSAAYQVLAYLNILAEEGGGDGSHQLSVQSSSSLLWYLISSNFQYLVFWFGPFSHEIVPVVDCRCLRHCECYVSHLYSLFFILFVFWLLCLVRRVVFVLLWTNCLVIWFVILCVHYGCWIAILMLLYLFFFKKYFFWIMVFVRL